MTNTASTVTTTTTTTTAAAAPTTAPAAVFTLTRAQLADVLATVGVAIGRRPVVPVLGRAVFTVADDTLTVVGTNFDVTATVVVPQLSDNGPSSDGVVLLSHAELSAMVAAAAKGEAKRDADALTFTVDTLETTTPTAESVTVPGTYVDGKRTPDALTFTGAIVMVTTSVVTLTVAGYVMPLDVLPAGADYPCPVPLSAAALDASTTAGALTTVTVDRARFAELVTAVGVSVGKDDTLPMLTGVKLEVSEGELTAAATDRFRLSVGSVPVDAPAGFTVGRLIPFGVLAAALKRLATGDALTIGFRDGSGSGDPVTFAAHHTTFALRTLDADFPRFRQLLPARSDVQTTVTTDRAALARAVVKAAAMGAAAVDGHAAAVNVTVSDTGSVSVVPQLTGARAPELPATVDGVDVTVGFNPALLGALLGALDSSDVVVRFTTPARPATLAAPDTADGVDTAAVVHLLMPVRLPA